MTVSVFEDLVQGTDEWLQARCGVLTASTIGKLITPTLKVADNETARGLLYTLAAERITGHVDYVHPTFDMQRGTEDEPYARDLYAEHEGVTVREVGFIVRDKPTWTVGYSPDGLIGDDGLLEIKSRRPTVQMSTILRDTVPAANMPQLQAALFVTGRAWIDYVSFAQGMPLYVKRVFPDERWFDAIIDAAITFEKNMDEITTNYRTAVAGMPVAERRATIEEITF